MEIIVKISEQNYAAVAALHLINYNFFCTWKVNILNKKSAEERKFGIFARFEGACSYSLCQKVFRTDSNSFYQPNTYI